MTIANTTVKQIFQGNGATVTFAIPFAFQSNSEIRVVLRDESVTPAVETLQTLTTHYTLDANPAANVVFVTAPPSTRKILIRRTMALTQGTNYADNDAFASDTPENDYDRLVILVQELRELVGRGLHFSESVASGHENLTLPDMLASRYLRVNSGGTGVEWVVDSYTPTVTASYASPQDVVAGTGIVRAGGSATIETIFIRGSGGAVDISANPQISAGTLVGQILFLVCTSDTNTVQLDDGNGLKLNGSALMEADSTIMLQWYNSLWNEISRKI